MQRNSQTAGNLGPESRGRREAASSYFPNCFVTESTQPREQGPHFAGPYRHAFHILPHVSYTQQRQCTLASQSVLLEATRSQALLSQKTRHVLAAPRRRAAPLSHCDASLTGRKGRCQDQLLSPPHTYPWGEASEHQSFCFSEGAAEKQIGSVHRADSAGAGSSFHQKLQ